MPVFDTVLWDWNGTLLDDAALCCELLNTMLARHGYAPVGIRQHTCQGAVGKFHLNVEW